MNTRKIKVKVIDRVIKRGWLWDSYLITVRLLDEGCTMGGQKIVEIKGNVENYWQMPPGSIGSITAFEQDDGSWSIYQ